MEHISGEINYFKLDIDFFKTIIFSVRKNTSFDHGTKVSVDINSIDFEGLVI